MISGIVLAAGESRRMGQCKLLLPYRGSTVLQHLVEELETSDLDEIVVVLGHQAEAVEAVIQGSRTRSVRNPDHAMGMLSSVRCGLQAVDSRAHAVMVILGDQPSLTADVVDAIIYAFHGTESSLIVPKYRGRRGHPLLFSTKYRDAVMGEYDEVGLRGLVHAHGEEVFELPVASELVLMDMDTPEDYRRELGRLH